MTGLKAAEGMSDASCDDDGVHRLCGVAVGSCCGRVTCYPGGRCDVSQPDCLVGSESGSTGSDDGPEDSNGQTCAGGPFGRMVRALSDFRKRIERTRRDSD